MLQLYYTTLEKNEKRDLIDLIVIKCQCRPSTATAWVYGTRSPFPLAQQAIADIIGISRDKLFPVDDSKVKFQKA